MSERKILEEYYNLQTCSDRRLSKIKNIITKSKTIINKDLNKVNITDVTKFLRHINNSDFTSWTKNDYKKIFKNFLKWHYKEDFLKWQENINFKDGFKCVSKKKAFNKQKINKNTLITPEELETLLRTSKSLKWKALLTLLYESAFRPCEIVNLKWRDLNFDDSRSICSVRTTSPKTKDTREIPVKDCIVHLKRWRDEYEYPNRTSLDYVFPNPQDRTKHLSEAGISELIKRLCVKAGLRNIYPYVWRHSRIYFVQKRLGARIASKYAGHSLETSEIYDHLDDDDVEEAMLDKIYPTKELTKEKRHELEIEVEELKLKQKQHDEEYNKTLEIVCKRLNELDSKKT
jgi:integrase